MFAVDIAAHARSVHLIRSSWFVFVRYCFYSDYDYYLTSVCDVFFSSWQRRQKAAAFNHRRFTLNHKKQKTLFSKWTTQTISKIFYFSTAAAAAALCFSTAASKMTSWTSFIQSTKAKRNIQFLLKQRTTTDHSPAMRSADDSSIACRIQRRAPNCQCRRAAAPARTRRTNSARRNKSRLDYSVIIFFRIEKWHYLLSFWPTFLIKLEIRTHII